MSDAPAAPVALLDPALLAKKNEELSNRINGLEGDKQALGRQVDILNNRLAQEKSVSASARGAMGPLKEEIKTLRAQLQDLTARAGRAEGKFQALEGTATMMAQGRDKANAAAAALLAERDEAQKKAAALQEDFEGMRAEFVKLKVDLEKSQAEAKALRQAPAPKAK